MDMITLTYVSIVVQILPCIIIIILGFWTIYTLKSETVEEIANTSALLASTQTSITRAEIPFPLLAAIAHLYGMNLHDFRKLWIKEKKKRCRKVLEVYQKDCLTTKFIQKFGSKYLLHGYVGSEALLSRGIIAHTPSPRSPYRDRTYEAESSRVKSSRSIKSHEGGGSDRIRKHQSTRSSSGQDKIPQSKKRPHQRTADSKGQEDPEREPETNKRKRTVIQKSQYVEG
ncbi:hypothetical protein RB195_015476 [Necator americanus]|uniref:Anoctamin n=1 Tax=Necator americanus TaxID=51031 RepID=A0ABR1E4R4_NECAM